MAILQEKYSGRKYTEKTVDLNENLYFLGREKGKSHECLREKKIEEGNSSVPVMRFVVTAVLGRLMKTIDYINYIFFSRIISSEGSSKILKNHHTYFFYKTPDLIGLKSFICLSIISFFLFVISEITNVVS